MSKMLGGWSINASAVLQGGQPITSHMPGGIQFWHQLLRSHGAGPES